MRLPVFTSLLLLFATLALVGCGTGNSASTASDVHFLFSGNLDAGQIDAYQIDGTQLTPTPGSPFASNGSRVYAVIADPQRRFLYAANAGTLTENLTTFAVDGKTGALSKVSTTPTNALGLSAFAVHPSGNYLYAGSGVDWASPSGGAIHIYRVSSSGNLTRLGSVAVPAGMSAAESLALDPSGKFLFAGGTRVTSPYDQGVSAWVYAVSNGGSILSALPSLYSASPPWGPPGSAPGVAATSKYVYVPTAISSTLGVFQWNSDGSLLALPSPQLPFGANPFAVAATPDNRFVYVTDSARQAVIAFAANPDGSLSQIQDVKLGTGPYLLPEQLAVDASGNALYVGGGDGLVFVFNVGADGRLSQQPNSPYANGSQTIDPIALF